MKRTLLDAWWCERGHVCLHPGDACPGCGAPLRATRVAPEATLVLVTTVRVSASDRPFALGLAVTVRGRARTLCRIEGPVRGSGRDPVVLERRGDTIVARSRPRSERGWRPPGSFRVTRGWRSFGAPGRAKRALRGG